MAKSFKFDLVYVTHDSLSEGIGMSQILPLLCNISRNGLKVCVISCEKENLDRKVQRILADFDIKWVSIPFGRHGSIGGLGRLLRLALNLPSGDIYHCRSDIAAAATVLRGKKFLWDVRGLWTDQKVVMKTISSNKLVIFFSRKLETIAAVNASHVVALTNRIIPVLKARHPRMTSNCSVIPTCTNLELFKLRKFKSKKFILVLSGVYNDYYDLELTKKFISEFRFLEPLEVWWVHGREAVKNSLGVGEDSDFSVSQLEMPDILADSSFGLAFCKQDAGVSLLGVMPTKIAEFLATGRPVIVNQGIGDLDSMLREFNCGVILNDQTEISRAIIELKALLSDLDIESRCRKAAEKYFDMNNAVIEYMKAYQIIKSNLPEVDQ